MELKFEHIEDLMKNHGYNATKELQYDAFLALLYFSSKNITPGQDIYAVCLEGPPGAGKTFYAETYTKLVKDIYDTEVEFIEYQCDATTGKNELFEDINISAAIRHDDEKVSIPGKLVRAIKEVNKGKKVILFIDEYDKAREETDAFLLQFLQSGKLNSNQFGDLGIERKFINNLQVILCKNDFREQLSGPLSRRLRMIRLDYMKPTIFYEVAKKILLDSDMKVSEGLVNLVSLMYNAVYEEKDLFVRIPSCSEMLIAITDADRLMKFADAPKHIIYDILIKGIFKEKDDIETFEKGITSKNKELKDLIDEMKSSKQEVNEESITIMLANSILKEEADALNKENRRLNEELKSKLEELEKQKKENEEKSDEALALAQQYIEEYSKKINELETLSEEKKKGKLKIGESSLELTNDDEEFISNFKEEEYIKRGKSIFSVSKSEFTNIANIDINAEVTKNIVDDAKKRKLMVYENGILLFRNSNMSLVLSRTQVANNEKIKFFVDSVVTPIELIKKMIDYLNNGYLKKNLSLINIDSIVYINEKFKKLFASMNFDELMTISVYENLYRFNYKGNLEGVDTIFSNLNENYLEEDIRLSKESSDKILTLR